MISIPDIAAFDKPFFIILTAFYPAPSQIEKIYGFHCFSACYNDSNLILKEDEIDEALCFIPSSCHPSCKSG